MKRLLVAVAIYLLLVAGFIALSLAGGQSPLLWLRI